MQLALRLENQAQFHPGRYLQGLAAAVAGDGSNVFESSRALAVKKGVVTVPGGEIRARDVFVATHMPFLDRGLLFAKAYPARSYAVAARTDAAAVPREMYINVEQPSRSIRSTPGPDGSRWLIVGGEGHKVGDEPDTRARYAALESFLRERFGGEAEYRWSAHDFVPVDGLPFIGRLRGGPYVATGFAKWGLTKGTLAAEIVTDGILGRKSRWADLYDARRRTLGRPAMRMLADNGRVAAHFVGDRLRRSGDAGVDRLAPGEGRIVRLRGRLTAAYRDDAGRLHTLSPRCTHLGCIVAWNGADRMWECPCHGSCFAGDGTLLEGPATTDPDAPLGLLAALHAQDRRLAGLGAGGGRGADAGRLARDAPLAALLRPVEGGVGALEERVRVVLGAELGDSGRQEELAGVRDRARGDRGLDPAVELLGVGKRRLRQDHRELVAADAAGDVGVADDVADALGDLGEHGVAGEVADAVVDALKSSRSNTTSARRRL